MVKYSFVLIFSLLNLFGFAQNLPINYANIFSTSFTYVGIPQSDSLRILGVQQNEWHQWYSFKIPDNTLAMDGNERRVFFLTKEAMVVQE